jgi:hypothetical protein
LVTVAYHVLVVPGAALYVQEKYPYVLVNPEQLGARTPFTKIVTFAPLMLLPAAITCTSRVIGLAGENVAELTGVTALTERSGGAKSAVSLTGPFILTVS